MEVNEVVHLFDHGLIGKDEARTVLGFKKPENNSGDLAETERVLRVISGWNPARVSTAEAIKPAIDYFDAKTVPDLG